jgi:hypothetical protein
MKNAIIIDEPQVAIVLTAKQATEIGIDMSLDEQRGELKTVGLWQIPVSFKALCISATYTKEGFTKFTQKIIYGTRTLTDVKQGGYELEGYVSVNGKKYSAFTSSQLFEVDGKLIDVAIIHARIK